MSASELREAVRDAGTYIETARTQVSAVVAHCGGIDSDESGDLLDALADLAGAIEAAHGELGTAKELLDKGGQPEAAE